MLWSDADHGDIPSSDTVRHDPYGSPGPTLAYEKLLTLQTGLYSCTATAQR